MKTAFSLEINLKVKNSMFFRSELECLCRIYKKLVSNCLVTSRALAANSAGSVIAKPHALIEVSNI